MRVYKEPHELQGGEYTKYDVDGNWYGVPPDTDMLGCFAKHKVIEHEDGTITVSPSILIGGTDEKTRQRVTWHGFLEKGIWREV